MSDIGLHVADVGAIIEVTLLGSDGLAQDISSASTKQMKLTKPSNEVLAKPADFTTDGTDGKLRYVTIADDLDEHGKWNCRVFLALAGGWSGHSSREEFPVYKIVG